MYIPIDLLIMHRMAEAKASAAWPQFNTLTADYSWGYCVTIGIYIIKIMYIPIDLLIMQRMAEAKASAITAWPQFNTLTTYLNGWLFIK